MIAFIGGMFVGAVIGYFVCALLVVAAEPDTRREDDELLGDDEPHQRERR